MPAMVERAPSSSHSNLPIFSSLSSYTSSPNLTMNHSPLPTMRRSTSQALGTQSQAVQTPNGIQSSQPSTNNQSYQTPPRLTETDRMDSSTSINYSPAISSLPTTTSGGKTSMVIEKLTMDLEKLRREYRSEKAAKEEAMLELQATKGRIAKLQEQNSHLAGQCAANDSSLARKERRLDELRGRLEAAEGRTKRAEEQSQMMARQADEAISQAQHDVSEARAQAKYHEGAYTTLQREYSTLSGRITILRKEFSTYQKEMDARSREQRKQLLQLEVVIEQERQQAEFGRGKVAEMEGVLRGYFETEKGVKTLEGKMLEVVTEMRWVMRLNQARGAV